MYSKSREEIVLWLSKYFKNYYDINNLESLGEDTPVMRCDLHVTNQRFFMFKKNVIWQAFCHEYLYIFSVTHLTVDLYKRIEKYVFDEGMKLIEPGPNHMYTYLTFFIVADEADPEAVKLVRKNRFRKDFKFSLHGWMELHTALYTRDPENIATNRTGREYRKLLGRIKKISNER